MLVFIAKKIKKNVLIPLAFWCHGTCTLQFFILVNLIHKFYMCQIAIFVSSPFNKLTSYSCDMHVDKKIAKSALEPKSYICLD